MLGVRDFWRVRARCVARRRLDARRGVQAIQGITGDERAGLRVA